MRERPEPAADHEKWMRAAIRKAAAGARAGQTPFGACIVRRGRIVACEHNTVWKDTDITSHGEVHAIRVACKKLKSVELRDCVIYSTCEPCPMCFAACHWAKVREIRYGVSIADARRLGFSELGISNVRMKKLGRSPVKVYGGLLREENLDLFRKWNDSPKKRVY